MSRAAAARHFSPPLRGQSSATPTTGHSCCCFTTGAPKTATKTHGGLFYFIFCFCGFDIKASNEYGNHPWLFFLHVSLSLLSVMYFNYILQL